ERQSGGDGILHGRRPNDRGGGTCPRGRRRRLFLRHPAQGVRRPGPDGGAVANQDVWCPPAAVDELEKALKAAGVTHEIYRYDAAHAFANERSAAYDVACANQAWEHMAAFLGAQIA